MRYGFTGTQKCPKECHKSIRQVIASLADATEFTTGGAYGVDTEVAIAADLFPSVTHRLCLPQSHYNHQLPWIIEDRIGRYPIVDRAGISYRERNERILHFSDVLIAFPMTAKEEQRSGTWMTIRMTRKIRMPVRMFPLDEMQMWIPSAVLTKLIQEVV